MKVPPQTAKHELLIDRDPLNSVIPCVDHPTWLTRINPPFKAPNIQLFAVNYRTGEVDLTHPCISQFVIPESLSNAVHKRQAEYVIGRYCAQQALTMMGIDYPVGRCSDRSPKWPPSILGSITHTHCFSMAAVGSNQDYMGIGIDTETVTPATKIDTLAEQFITTYEINLGISNMFTNEVWLYIVFSAKESIYKSLYPKVKKYFGFFAVEIILVNKIDSRHGLLIARLTKPLGCFEEGFLLNCSYLIDTPYIHTQVLL